jgi:DNA polymerase I-like protein with 3'-5' exonuclease and polymerase domains
MAQKLALAEAEVRRVQHWYYSRFPRIKQWQDRVVSGLFTTRSVRNIWGFRRVYFDRLEGTIQNQAVAWIGQSTVAILINKIWEAIADSEEARDLGIQILLQVHDSLVFQYPQRHALEARAAIQRLARVPIPYPSDPLIIPVGLKYSTESWGHCE